MIRKTEFFIPSSDGVSRLHCVCWEPERTQAVLQIAHGMMEHILRYEEFAGYLADHGVAVIGHDHLGHGQSCDQEHLGFFAKERGDVCVVKDMERVQLVMKKGYPKLPYFMMGHSMGSFVLRRYLTIYGSRADGAILMGTGNQPYPVILAGSCLAKVIGKVKGERYRSRLMQEVVLGSYNRKFSPNRTTSDWLSRDSEMVYQYQKDPLCTFLFTNSAYRDLFHLLSELKNKHYQTRIPKELPVFLVSGDKDPVGNFGNGVRQVYRQFQNLGIQDVTLRLYPDARHEILNEINRKEVYADIWNWMQKHIISGVTLPMNSSS